MIIYYNPYQMSCSHYKRGASLLAPCCQEFFPCRFCHDKQQDEEEKDPKKAHTMDRKAVKQIKCLTCETIQDAKQVCEFCHIVLGTYWCPLCVLLDNEDKGQYHCEECGICRIEELTIIFTVTNVVSVYM